MKKKLIGYGLLLLVSNLLFSTIVNTGPSTAPRPGYLFEITANGELAFALCFGKTPYTFDEVFFKGPSGIKIRVVHSFDKNAKIDTTEFFHVGGHSTLKKSTSLIFYEQNLPIPTIFTVNGVAIAGLGDGGAKEKEFQIAVQKEYSKLPNDFQQGLREFYTYSLKSNIALSALATSLNFVIGDQVEPFHVDQVINTNSLDVQNFQMEFNCN